MMPPTERQTPGTGRVIVLILIAGSLLTVVGIASPSVSAQGFRPRTTSEFSRRA